MSALFDHLSVQIDTLTESVEEYKSVQFLEALKSSLIDAFDQYHPTEGTGNDFRKAMVALSTAGRMLCLVVQAESKDYKGLETLCDTRNLPTNL